jgi:hypothetical protein
MSVMMEWMVTKVISLQDVPLHEIFSQTAGVFLDAPWGFVTSDLR